ncbi:MULTISPECIES: GGDEF domain-containing protein [Janthinobacterium]|uniref:diguanylate cyclase n=1 Tax=Janthinobacterium lividum TaxID=29581 RepID=A0ABU0XTF3_9BURK|nr:MULTISPECIES: GGDEF domain-containing protein [Janthinobacterium]MDQ4625481.1 GGDEF domain-containing protein [Janthinobacterium lividum]MDQ4672916.1 GGDEF domain-containing protein [Janthinobacterium lividum]MDQ4683644.1 GGDEF domain-containing protein [Janthinobacterium lividum]
MRALHKKMAEICRVPHAGAYDLSQQRYFYLELKTPSLALQCMAFIGMLASYFLAGRLSYAVGQEYLICVAGVLLGIVISCRAGNLRYLNIGGLVTAIFSCAGFRVLMSASGISGYWMFPLGVLMTVSISAIASDPLTYLVLILVVWFLLGLGGFEQALLASGEWSVMYAAAGVLIGLLFSSCFFRLRYMHHVATARLEDMAYRDYLTGIPNRRCFLDALHAAMRDGKSSPAYLLMADVDDFKRINDEFGHDTGDIVLRELGQIIAASAAGCPHGRIGGEEFAMLIDADLACVAYIADQLLDTVRRSTAVRRGVTISVGIARMQGNAVADSFRRADEALYSAKLSGKDCVVFFPDAAPA